MYVFNQGKYRSLHAQQVGELEAIAQVVAQDRYFRPTYHLAAPTGLLNDPNGLIFDGEKYHIFYQWFPYAAMHGMKHWKHFITADFCTFKEADPLIPDEMFESHGCYSGGAILWQDKIVAFYTGNTRRSSDNQRVPHQNIAIFDKSGKLLEKRCLINSAPEGYTEHVRDPKPFITKEGKIRFVLGAQREDLTGTALLYEMDDLNATPRLLSELNLQGFSNQNVFMWECPDLFQLEYQDVFIWSPQGKLREETRFQNNYHATYAVGKLNGNQLVSKHIEELDYGFDFYAPQTVQGSDGLLLGWIGLPDLTYPTDKYQWHSMLTIPRQLTVQNDRIYQRPANVIQHLLGEKRLVDLAEVTEIEDLDTSYVQIFVENRPLVINLFSNNKGQFIQLRYENGRFSIDRSATEQTDLMQNFGSQRHCEIASLTSIELFLDRSVLEIYLNDGEKVLTSRFFIEDRKNSIMVSQPVKAIVAKIKPINYCE